MNKKLIKCKPVNIEAITEPSGFIVARFDNNYIIGISSNGFSVLASRSAGEFSARIAYENDIQQLKKE